MATVTKSTIPLTTKRGRPRSEEVERAILQAAAAILNEGGFASMSIEEVAALAGVGKASIYRRWSSKGALALDAFLGDFLQLQPPVDTGSLESDMNAALTHWVRAVSGTPSGRTLVGLIAEAQLDPELASAWRTGVIIPSRNQHRPMIERAIERGEIPIGSDVDVLMDMLYGPAYHRLLHWHLPLSEEFVRRVVAVVVVGAKAGAAVTSEARGLDG
jgi:AcrR family transcriptional regulator